MPTIFIIISLLLSLSHNLIVTMAPPTGRTIYVTTYGNDSTGDGSFGNPYASLAEALTIANSISTTTNPITINMAPGTYTENNSSGPLAISANGVSITGASQLSTIIVPSSLSQGLLSGSNTTTIANLTLNASGTSNATALSCTAGYFTTLSNVNIVNFQTGFYCEGSNSTYIVEACFFSNNITGISINNTTVDCTSSTIAGSCSLSSPNNVGINITGSSALLNLTSSNCTLCENCLFMTSSAQALLNAVDFQLNVSDIIVTTGSQLTVSDCNFLTTYSSSDLKIQAYDSGSFSKIISCAFNGFSSSNTVQGSAIKIRSGAQAYINGGSIMNYTTAITDGISTDSSSTAVTIDSLYMKNNTTDIIQSGTTSLTVNDSRASSTKLTINSATNVLLNYLDLITNAYKTNNAIDLQTAALGNFVGLQAPTTVTSSYTLSLPTATPTTSQTLRTSTTTPTQLTWITTGGSITPTTNRNIYVTTYGNDSTGDGSFDNSYASLAKAITTANSISTATTPVNIVLAEGTYTENNSSGALAITSDGISIIGSSALGTIISPSTLSQNLLSISTTTRISNITFKAYGVSSATALSCTSGYFTILSNVQCINFKTGFYCEGSNSTYVLDTCIFNNNGTGMSVNNTTMNCTDCSIIGSCGTNNIPLNMGINLTGASALLNLNSSSCTLCQNALSMDTSAQAYIHGVTFQLNIFDIIVLLGAQLYVSASNFLTTYSASDRKIYATGSNSFAEITGCTFNGFSASNVAQGSAISVANGAQAYINGGSIMNYTTAVTDGLTTDSSTTSVLADAVYLKGNTTDITQNGTTSLSLGACFASSSKITINSATNVLLSYYDLVNNNALVMPAGSAASPSLKFSGSTNTGISSPVANTLSFDTNGVEGLNIGTTGIVTIDNLSTAGIVHNSSAGALSTSLIVNADISASAAIGNNKLATLTTSGLVANSATTATNTNTASTIVARDVNGAFSAGTITATLVGNASSATTSTNFSSSLTGDVTGTQSATVVSLVGGQTAANVASATVAANSATNTNTASTIVERDTNGAFSAGTISATLVGNATTATTSTTSTTSTNFSGSLNGDVTGTQSATVVSTVGGQTAANVATATVAANAATNNNTASTIVARDVNGAFSAGTITATLAGNSTTATTSTNFSGSLSGNVTGTQSATVVSTVGGQSAANVASATTAANAATNTNTASTIVKRDASGAFSAGTITATLVGNVTGSASNNVLKAGDTMTGTLVIPAGTAAAPSLKFTGSTNTGISAATSNTLSFDTNGTEQMNIGTSTMTMNLPVLMTNLLCNQALQVATLSSSGSVTANATTSILYLKTSNTITVTVTFPSSPINGQLFTIAVNHNTDTTNLVNDAGTGGATFVNPISSLSVGVGLGANSGGTSVTYIYYSSDNTWIRLSRA